jgi:hypothetical protein
MNSSHYNQFNIHQDKISSPTSCTYPHYSHSTKLTLPSPVTHLPSSATAIHNNNNSVVMTSSRKTKVNITTDTKKNKVGQNY